MRRCYIGVVINFLRVFTKATRRLHGNENIAVQRAGDEDIAVILHNASRCFAPVLNQLLLHLFLHERKEFLVFCAGDFLRLLKLLVRQHTAVIRRIACQLTDKLLGILRHIRHVIATFAHSCQHAADAFNRIQTNSAANIGITRRIIVEDNSDFFLAVSLMAQHRPFLRLRSHALHTLLVRQIAYIAIFQNLFVRYRHAMNNAIEFGQRYADRNLHRIHALEAVFPFLIRGNRRISRENRHISLLEIFNAYRAAARHRELHHIQQHINRRHAVLAEEHIKNLRQAGHAHLLRRHAVAEYANGVHALCLQRLNQRRLIGQIAPNPFITVEQNACCRSARHAKVTLKFGKVSVNLGRARMINAAPVHRVRRGNVRRSALRQLCHVQPNICIVQLTAEHRISFNNFQLLGCQLLRQLALLAACSINIKGQAQPLQLAHKALQKRRIQTCAHPFHQDNVRAAQLALPFAFPLRGLCYPVAGGLPAHRSALLQLLQGLLHHAKATDNIRQKYNLTHFSSSLIQKISILPASAAGLH